MDSHRRRVALQSIQHGFLSGKFMNRIVRKLFKLWLERVENDLVAVRTILAHKYDDKSFVMCLLPDCIEEAFDKLETHSSDAYYVYQNAWYTTWRIGAVNHRKERAKGMVKSGGRTRIFRTGRKRMMKFDLHVQRQVIWLGLDDSSPNSMLPHIHGGQDGATPEEWRKSVVLFTCSMLNAGLIYPLPEIEDYAGKSPGYIRNLLEEGDSKNGFDRELIWYVMHFFGTEKLLVLLRELKLNEWTVLDEDLSTPLGDALADLNVVQR